MDSGTVPFDGKRIVQDILPRHLRPVLVDALKSGYLYIGPPFEKWIKA